MIAASLVPGRMGHGVAGIGKDDFVFRPQELGPPVDVCFVGCGDSHSVHSTGVDICTDVNLHPEIPLLAF